MEISRKVGENQANFRNSTGMEISEDMFICIYLLFSTKFWKMPFDSPQEMFRKNCNVWLVEKAPCSQLNVFTFSIVNRKFAFLNN